MAAGDLKISSEIKNDVLKNVLENKGGATSHRIGLFVDDTYSSGSGEVVQFTFSNGVASLNGSVSFDITAPKTINKLSLFSIDDVNGAIKIADITLVGDEVKTFTENGLFAVMSLSIELKEDN